MLHIKFQGHRSIGSGGEGFLRFLPSWAWWPSWSCDPDHLNNFSFLKALEAVNLVAIGLVVTEEKSFEIVDGRADRRQKTELTYTISAPGAFGSDELNKRAKRP